MKGYFKGDLPFIDLKINNKLISFLVDTGFNGQIMLPKDLIKELNLKPNSRGIFVTASGEINTTLIFGANLDLPGMREVEVSETDMIFGILGMGLLKEFELVVNKKTDAVEIN